MDRRRLCRWDVHDSRRARRVVCFDQSARAWMGRKLLCAAAVHSPASAEALASASWRSAPRDQRLRIKEVVLEAARKDHHVAIVICTDRWRELGDRDREKAVDVLLEQVANEPQAANVAA